MGIKIGPATAGKPIHNSKPTSKLSKVEHVTKPEGRHPQTHSYGVSGANSMLKKHHY